MNGVTVCMPCFACIITPIVPVVFNWHCHLHMAIANLCMHRLCETVYSLGEVSKSALDKHSHIAVNIADYFFLLLSVKLP